MTTRPSAPAAPGGSRRATLLVQAGLAVAFGLLFVWASDLYQRAGVAERRAAAAVAGGSYSSSLSNALNQRIALVRGLVAFTTVEVAEGAAPLPLAVFAQALRGPTDGIRNISIAPDFVIRYVDPVAGNERVIGNNLLEDKRPGFADAVRAAIQTREVVVHPPLKLIQGGVGLIARGIVFQGDQPWGAVGVVFDFQPVLDQARLPSLTSLDYALRDHAGQVVAGDPAVFDADPIIDRVEVPGGHWELAVAPRGGWTAAVAKDGGYALFLAGFLALMALVHTVAFLLMDRRAALERLVAIRTRELADARALADRRADDLASFAHIAAHDLQEPLRAVTSYTQLLARRLGDGLDGESRQYIGHAVAGARRLKALLHDVELYLAEDKLPLSNKPLHAKAAVDWVIEQLEPAVAEAGAVIACEELPHVLADERRLKEIFHAFLSNAVQYRHPDRPPKVRVSGEVVGREARIAVSDNGVGIDPRFADQVFEVFRRLQARDERSGTGMGLAIARKMVQRLGGRIELASTPGEGSTFTVVLPVATVDEA